MLKVRHASLCFLFITTALPGAATTVQSTTFANWTSGITGTPTFVDVESLSLGNYSTAAGVTDASYLFTGPDGSSWSLGVQTFSGKTGLFGAADGRGAIEVTLPGAGQSAIYVDVNTEANNTLVAGPVTLTLSDGETFTVASGQFGLSISHPITWYTLTTSVGQAPFLQWAYFGNSSLPQDGNGGTGDPAQTPEAATLALVGGGMLVVFGAKRRFANRLAF
ncbi:MAG TPA: hypothetical protein VFA65_18365 [Bryobacteraceae bacterium]|nr:hypothetical protein [Bryobacteraceae bacterium]